MNDHVEDDDEEVPGWLRELGASWSAQGAPDETAGEADEVPDWLKDLRESLPDEGDVDPEIEDESEVPSWLANLPAGESVEEEPGDEAPAPTEELVDESADRLADVESGDLHCAEEDDAALAGGEEEAGIEDSADGLPDWLAELRGQVAGGAPVDEPASAEDLPEAEVPDWLEDVGAGAGGAAEGEATSESGEVAKSAVYSGDLPDWLAELRGQALGAEPDEQAPDLPGADLPDWLAELREHVPGDKPVEEMPAMPESTEPDVPDWLAELRAEAAQRESADRAPGTPDLPEAELPDWLADMRPAAVEEPGEREAGAVGDDEGEPVSPEADLPDWLAELRSPAPEVLPPGAAEGGSVPDWLADTGPGEEEVSAEAPASPEPSQPSEVTGGEQSADWLASLRPPAPDEPELADLDSEMAGSELETPGARVPDWLEEVESSRQATSDKLEEAESAYAAGEIPDWLVPSEGELEEETLARAEIPEWLLALKPTALRAEGEPEGPSASVEEPVEETGILAGLRGTLPVEMLIAQPRAVTTHPVAAAPVTDTPDARLFAEIVGHPAEHTAKEIVQPSRGLLTFLPRWLIYIALIAAVALPLLVDGSLLTRDIEAGLPVEAMHSAVEALDASSVVLVAFDYDPSSSGEMDVIARSLLGDVMDRGARIVVISTLPAGPATAERVIGDLASERPSYGGVYGERYANLGYIPGQATAVRLVAQSLPLAVVRDFYGNPVGELAALDGVVSVASFDMILELAASQETLRWWIEQAGAPYELPVSAGISGAVEPFARAYFEVDPPQLLGLVPGIPGAASYEVMASGETELDDGLGDRLDAQLAGHFVFVVVLLIAALVGLVRGDARREA